MPKRLPEHVYRRRRLTALTGFAAVVLAIGVALEPPGDGSPSTDLVALAECHAAGVRELAGQRLIVRMGDKAGRKLRRDAGRGQIGGVIVFPDPDHPPGRLRREIERLQDAASATGNPPLLVTIDQEGGSVKRLPAGPPHLSAPELGETGDEQVARVQGELTGRFLAELGINVDLAPVLDVPGRGSFISGRAFGRDPETVGRLGGAFAEGLRAGGVLATAKHFPGLGLARTNTDLAPSVITDARARLERGLAPFRAAIEQGIPLVMVSNAGYSALGTREPATTAEEVIDGLLRQQLGYDGVVITDDLEAISIQARMSPSEAALAATRAGADLLLLAQGNEKGVARDLARAARRGKLARGPLEDSCGRVLTFRERLR